MGIFDFFKSNKQTRYIDLTDLKFISDDHVKFKNKIEIPEHNSNCWRGLRIQASSLSSKTYTFTLYNLDQDHDLWEENIAMPPKQMHLIEVNLEKIVLQTNEKQVSAIPFIQDRLTIHLESGTIDRITLEKSDLFQIDFYRSTSNYSIEPKSFDSLNDGDVEELHFPSTDVTAVIAWCEIIGQCKDLKSLKIIYGQKSDFTHPQIYCQFGISFLALGDRIHAKRALFKGGRYGLSADLSLYNQEFINYVGQCLFLLITEFKYFDIEALYKLTALSYVYLSKAITQAPGKLFDAYKARALLFNNHPFSVIVQALISEEATLDGLIEPYIISDLLTAHKAPRSLHLDAYQTAIFIHRRIKDTTIDGIPAWKYTMEELVELGDARQLKLFKNLETQFKAGTFDVTLEEYKAAINHV